MATNTVERVSIGSGHSRSPQRCGYAKPLLRPETRLWPPAAQFKGCAGGQNLPTALLPDVLRDRVHQSDHPAMGRPERHSMALHRSRQAAAERFHRVINDSLRDELLNEEIFDSLDDVRRKLALWRYDYNTVRPHSSLGNQTPKQARQALEQFEGSAPTALAQSGTPNYQNQTCKLSL